MNEDVDLTPSTALISSEIVILLFCLLIKHAEEDSLLN